MLNKNNILINCSHITRTYALLPCFYGKTAFSRLSRSGTSRLLPTAGNKTRSLLSQVFFLIVIPFFLLGSPSAGLAEIASLKGLTDRMQTVYEETRDLKADFIQEVTIKSMKKTDREEGTVWIKNPRMMYWDYKKPKVKKLIINSIKAWLYVAEDRMAYRQSADDVYRSRLVVKFLSGIGKLSEDFTIRFSKDGHTDSNGNYLLNLKAKEQGFGIDHMELTIDKLSFQIIQCRFNDDYGNATRLRFNNIRTNTGVADSFFTFTPPPDVEVADMP
jgi:outer membrane lipoprotein carrier protein